MENLCDTCGRNIVGWRGCPACNPSEVFQSVGDTETSESEPATTDQDDSTTEPEDEGEGKSTGKGIRHEEPTSKGGRKGTASAGKGHGKDKGKSTGKWKRGVLESGTSKSIAK